MHHAFDRGIVGDVTRLGTVAIPSGAPGVLDVKLGAAASRGTRQWLAARAVGLIEDREGFCGGAASRDIAVADFLSGRGQASEDAALVNLAVAIVVDAIAANFGMRETVAVARTLLVTGGDAEADRLCRDGACRGRARRTNLDAAVAARTAATGSPSSPSTSSLSARTRASCFDNPPTRSSRALTRFSFTLRRSCRAESSPET